MPLQSDKVVGPTLTADRTTCKGAAATMYPGRHATENPDAPALVFPASGETVTYGQLDSEANRIAHLFRSYGLKRLDHVAFYSENCAGLVTAMSAGERSGLYYTPVNSFLSTEEAAYIINNCRARVVISSRTKLEATRSLPELCPRVEHWLVFDDDSPPTPFASLAQELAGLPTAPLPNERLGTPMFYSSGTTGRPKAVRRSIDDVPPAEMLSIEEYGRIVFQLRPGMVFMSPAPMYHSGPQSGVAIATRLGAVSIIPEKFDAEEFLKLVDEHKVTHTLVVPTMLSRILRLPDEIWDSYDTSSLEAIVHGAAPCPVHVKEKAIERFGPIIYEYYGGTEANGIVGCNTAEWLEHKGSVGKGIMGEPVILDADGNELPPNTQGFVYFRGGNSRFEYLDAPDKTAEALDPTGTMSRIGDIGHVDEDGFLYLADRQSFVIISGGVNIYPQEVENLLSGHPDVLDVAVFGIPDEDMGEQVKAVVELADPALEGAEKEAELIAYCRDRIAKYKCPRSIDFTRSLPRSATGKLYKKQLQDAYWPPKAIVAQ
jgi:long-chain acyl-CoA synthetase